MINALIRMLVISYFFKVYIYAKSYFSMKDIHIYRMKQYTHTTKRPPLYTKVKIKKSLKITGYCIDQNAFVFINIDI